MSNEKLMKYATLVFDKMQTLPLFTPITIKGLLEEQGIMIPEEDIFEFMKALDGLIDYGKTNCYHLYHGTEVRPASFNKPTYTTRANTTEHFTLGHIVNSSIPLIIELPIVRAEEIQLRFYRKGALVKGQIFPLSFEKWCKLAYCLTQIMDTQSPTNKVKIVDNFVLPADTPSCSDYWVLNSISYVTGNDNVILNDIPASLSEPFIATLKSIHPTLAKYCPEI